MRKTFFKKLLIQHVFVILYLSLFFFFSRNLSYPLSLFLGVLTATLIAVLLSRNFSRSRTGRIERLDRYLKTLTNETPSFTYLRGENDEFGRLEHTASEVLLIFKKRADSMKEEEGRHSAVLSSMDDGVLVLDSTGYIVLANRKARELFGTNLEGLPVTDKIRDPVLLKFLDNSGKEQKKLDFELDTEPGQNKSLAVSVSPFFDREKRPGTVLVLYDISWLKKLENMRRDFVANVSHELKTPLTAIQGFSETLISEGLKDQKGALGFLKIIETNASRMSRIVSDLLTLSNIELGKSTFQITPENLQEVVDNVTETLPPKLKKEAIDLKISIDGTFTVLADKDRLKQVFINLLDNAFKYTEKGTISVSAVPDKQKINISVSDTGIGIPKNKLSRIGERFYRVDPSRSKEFGGTGLGLAIVKHMVISMEGDFFVESTLGKGTKVTFTLPQA